MQTKIDGYTLVARLRKARRRHPLTATEQALYHELVAVCNDVEWDDVFPCSNDELCKALNVSENTLNASRNTLINVGLIYYKSGKSKRQFGKYSFVKKFATTAKFETDAEGDAATNAETNPGGNAATNVADSLKTETENKPNDSVPAQAPPPPLKKSSSGKTKNKDEPPEPHWQALLTTWFAFNRKKFGDDPSFERDDPKILKRIVKRLRKRAEKQQAEWTEREAVSRFQKFLDKCFADKWLAANFLLNNLEKQFDKIILNHGNNPGTSTGHVRAAAGKSAGAERLADDLLTELRANGG